MVSNCSKNCRCASFLGVHMSDAPTVKSCIEFEPTGRCDRLSSVIICLLRTCPVLPPSWFVDVNGVVLGYLNLSEEGGRELTKEEELCCDFNSWMLWHS